jgi:hypothetical protein
MKSEVVNKILNKSSKYYWIEVPHLEKLTEKKFKDLSDLDFKDFSSCIEYGLKSISESDKDKPNCLMILVNINYINKL